MASTGLIPLAHGTAKVAGEQGYMKIEARFEKLEPAVRFGREYLTYVLWAITPEGRYAGDDVGPARSYDVTPDGQRFLFVKNLAGTDITRLELVLNWDLALRASLANTGR